MIKTALKLLLFPIAIAVGAYVLAIIQCECGPLSPLRAVSVVMPWGSFEFYVLIPIGVMAGELLIVGWEKSSVACLLQRKPSVRTDVFYWILQATVLQQAVVAAITGGTFAVLFTYAHDYSLKLGVWANPIVQVGVIFLVTDFAAYWGHRWLHSVPALWEAHKVHHSATDFHILLTFRFHPVERVLWDAVNVVLALLLGADMGSFVVFILVYNVLGQLQHVRLNWTYGPVGQFVVSPAFHRLHHAVDREHHDLNFGARLTIWDRLFGTYSNEPIDLNKVGVEHNTYVENPILSEFGRPFYVFFVEIWRAKQRYSENFARGLMSLRRDARKTNLT
jgi:sterol desaturase/sphingolipid hydroxylase (fatty acid hydroxylase superfamily)